VDSELSSELTSLQKKQAHYNSLLQQKNNFEAQLYLNSELNPLAQRIKAINDMKT
jgi:uncharacterized protein YdcH (DUF465 family)